MKRVRWIFVLTITIALVLAIVPGILKDKSFIPDRSQTVFAEDDGAVPDFVPDEVIASADSLAHAKKIASAYGLELKSFSYGIAVFAAPNPEAAVEASKELQHDGIPQLNLNFIYHTCETDGQAYEPYRQRERAYEYDEIEGKYLWMGSLSERDRDYTYMSYDGYVNRENNLLKFESASNAALATGINTNVYAYQWHHSEINTEPAWDITTGEGVTVAVIDSGINIDHPAFEGRISGDSFNAYTNEIGIEYVRDDLGHGTHVSGIVAGSLSYLKYDEDGLIIADVDDIDEDDSAFWISGVAPDAEILVIKANIPNVDGFEEADLLRAINYAAGVSEDGKIGAARANIINMSLGRHYFWGESKIERYTLARAVANGVTIICAAGNDSNEHAGYPAAYPEVIAVSATKQGYKFDSTFSRSNYGPEIDVAAPGGNIFSANAPGTLIANWYGADGDYIVLSGTSMASPNTAGVAALILAQDPDLSPEDVREILRATAQDAGEVGRDDYFGYGIVSAYAALLGPDELCSVTYHFNDGIRNQVTVKAAPGSKLIEPKYPKFGDYVFDGWYVGETDYAFNFARDVVEDDIDLYANWIHAEDGMYAMEFPDANFRREVLRIINEMDGGNRTAGSAVTADDKASIAELMWLDVQDCNIADITGLQYFSGLEYFYCDDNELTELDVSHMAELISFSCSYNMLTELDVSNSEGLIYLFCNDNQLTELNVSNCSSLVYLICHYNQLTKLDLSDNIALEGLSCQFNKLTTLNVSSNADLRELFCNDNQLALLDVSNNEALVLFDCWNNRLTELDVSNNHALKELSCWINQLTSLDISNCPELTILDASMNYLTELDVSNNTELLYLICINNQLTGLDLSNNTALLILECSNYSEIFYDWQFIEGYGYNQLTSLELSANYALKALYCGGNQLTQIDVSSNSELEVLSCWENQLTGIDVSNNPALEALWCLSNQLTELDVSNNANLMSLDCGNNRLAELDVRNNPRLIEMWCYDNELEALDVSENTGLFALFCNDNNIAELDVSANRTFYVLNCANNQLSTLDISNNRMLVGFDCSHNQLTALDTSNNTALAELICNSNQLTALDVSKNTALEHFKCSDNELEALDVSGNTRLWLLDCRENYIKSLVDVIGWQEIGLILNENFLYNPQRVEQLPAIIITIQPASTAMLQGTSCELIIAAEGTVDGMELEYQWYSNTVAENSGGTPIEGAEFETLTVPDTMPLGTYYYYCVVSATDADSVTSRTASVDVIEKWLDGMYILEFPDANFRAEVLRMLNSMDRGNRTAASFVTEQDAAMLASQGALFVAYSNIEDMTGLRYFSNLTGLFCYGNQLTELDVSDNTKLVWLNCEWNQLTEIDVSGNTALKGLYCGYNELTELDVSNNKALVELYCENGQLTQLCVSSSTKLTRLWCGANQLTELDVSKNKELEMLSFWNNQLTEIDISNNTRLYYFACEFNQLTGLDLSNNRALTTIYCSGNQLTELDVSNCTKLEQLNCWENQLTGLDVSNNTALTDLDCSWNYMKSVDDVVGWQEIGLILNDSFRYYSQYVEQDPGIMIISQPVAALTILQGTSCDVNIWAEGTVSGMELEYQWYSNTVAKNSGGTPVEGATSATFTVPDTLSPGMHYFYCVVSSDDVRSMTSRVVSVEVVDELLDGMYAVEFPDPNFCAAILRMLNSWDGGNRTGSSVMTAHDKNILAEFSYLSVPNRNIKDMTGLQYLSGLRWIDCDNNQLTELDVSNQPNLMDLWCRSNQLTQLDMSNNPELERLSCWENRLTTLDLSNNAALIYLSCEYNQLTAANFTISGKEFSITVNGNGYLGVSAYNTDGGVDIIAYATPEEDSWFINWEISGEEVSNWPYYYSFFTDGCDIVANFAAPTALDGIAVTAKPTKTTYTEGDTLDLSGMVVTAAYSDGSSKAVIGYTTNPADGAVLNIVSEQMVTVSYEENGITKFAAFSVTVEAIVPNQVTSNADSGKGSLRAVVAAAKNGDVITFAPGVTAINLNSVIEIDKAITIDGGVNQNGEPMVVISGSGSTGIFSFTSPNTLVLKGLALKNGYAATYGGAIYVLCGSIEAENCVFDNNSASWGGAILAEWGTKCNITLTDCSFINNKTRDFYGSGGAIFGFEKVVATDCEFIGNEGYYGGAIDCRSLKATDCLFASNKAKSNGGAVNVGGQSSIYAANTFLEGCTFTSNTANYNGGAVSAGFMVATDCKFTGNISGLKCSGTYNTGHGGAIYCSMVTMSICDFTDNAAHYTNAALCPSCGCDDVYGTIKNIEPPLNAPEDLYLYPYKGGSLYLEWTSVEGADGYYVYQNGKLIAVHEDPYDTRFWTYDIDYYGDNYYDTYTFYVVAYNSEGKSAKSETVTFNYDEYCNH